MKTARAFTIVELLIVIVVIGILATLTIVAYNGIQQRAQASAASTALSQASKKLKAYEVDNGLYPTQLSDAGITDSSTTYQYTVNNSTNPKTFCITATNGTTSYYITSTSIPTSGGCAGHGQGGVAAVTNWAANPDASGTSVAFFGSMGGSQAPSTRTIATDRFHNGTSSIKIAVTGTGQLGITARTPTTNTYRVNAGERYSWSLWVYTTKAGTFNIYTEGTKVSDGTYTGGGGGASVAVPANTWTKLSGSFTPSIDMYVSQAGVYGLPVVSGDTVWADEFTISKTTTPINYADGSTPGWVWDGTPNGSTSTGPPQ